MSVFRDRDLEIFGAQMPETTKRIEAARAIYVPPTLEEQRLVYNIVVEYIREKKLKIYGGKAIDLLMQKNNLPPIYDPSGVPDIDVYSNAPVSDVTHLCNRLHNAGFLNVFGREAIHNETFSVFVGNKNYCDFSYVHWSINRRIPYEVVDGLWVTGSIYIVIDCLRVINDPLTSWWRIEKSNSRLHLLTDVYSLPAIYPRDRDFDASLGFTRPALGSTHAAMIDETLSFLENRRDIIVIGVHACNYFLSTCIKTEKQREREMARTHGNRNKQRIDCTPLRYVATSCIEFLSENYTADCLELIGRLRLLGEIVVKEHYPFFQFTGHFVEIYHEERIVVRAFTLNRKCVPYLLYPSITFDGTSMTKRGERDERRTLKIATWYGTLLYILIEMMMAYRDNDKAGQNKMYKLAGAMSFAKKVYFSEHPEKHILDDTPFNILVLECVGTPKDASFEKMERTQERRAAGERRGGFTYRPDQKYLESPPRWRFAISTGDEIRNQNNLVLTGRRNLDNYTDEEEDDDAESAGSYHPESDSDGDDDSKESEHR